MYLGVDPSLRSTGVCLIREDGRIVKVWQIKTIHKTLPQNLVSISNQMTQVPECLERMSLCGPEAILGAAIETPFVANNKLTTMTLSAVWGMLLCTIMKWQPAKLFEVHPGVLKRFVTGRAQGDKDQMILHTYKLWGFEHPCNDVVDAYGLAQLARCSDYPDKYTPYQQDVVRDYLRLKNAAGATVE